MQSSTHSKPDHRLGRSANKWCEYSIKGSRFCDPLRRSIMMLSLIGDDLSDYVCCDWIYLR